MFLDEIDTVFTGSQPFFVLLNVIIGICKIKANRPWNQTDLVESIRVPSVYASKVNRRSLCPVRISSKKEEYWKEAHSDRSCPNKLDIPMD